MPIRGLDFVVTGTGRSGTGYAAALFTAAGLPCSHEEYFYYWPAWLEHGERRHEPYARLRAPYRRASEGVRRWRSSASGDASWMAVPRLARFRGAVFLQVRHPLEVVRGLVGNRFFTDPVEHGHYHGYATRFFELTHNPPVDALRWWLEWNRMAERHATVSYALESLDADLFSGLLERLDVTDPAEAAAAALAHVPKTVNSAANAGWVKADLSWDDIPDTAPKDAAAALAERFGYDVHTPAEIDLRLGQEADARGNAVSTTDVSTTDVDLTAARDTEPSS